MPITLLDIPYDDSSSFTRGSASGPEALRAALRFDGSNSWNEDEHDVLPILVDPGDLSLDLDVLDPAFAPGISHPEPGGLSTREVIAIVQAIPRGRLVAADLVELNPVNDLRDLTARVGAKLVKEIVARMLR